MDAASYLVSCKPQTNPYIRYEVRSSTGEFEETAEQYGCLRVAGLTDSKTVRFVTPCTLVDTEVLQSEH